jgi:hypothetical protein
MRVNKGKAGEWYNSGVGKIYCAHAPKLGIQERLLNILKVMVDANHFSIVLSSVDTGTHAKSSRHYSGRAADISDIHVYGQHSRPVTVDNPDAWQAVRWLVDYGFRAGRENGPYDAVLLGPVKTRYNMTASDHSDHMHVSIHAAIPGAPRSEGSATVETNE